MKWTTEKPTEIGLYFRSNPALQRDITMQTVVNIDGELLTVHPRNESSRLINVKDMPNSFIWIKVPNPPHWKKGFYEIL